MGYHSVEFHCASIGFASGSERTVQTIPELIDYNARINPDYTFCIQAEKTLAEDSPGLLYITHAQLKHAVLYCSQWLRSVLDDLVLPEKTVAASDGRKAAPIALLLDSDINLLIHVYALISLSVPVSGTRVAISKYVQAQSKTTGASTVCTS